MCLFICLLFVCHVTVNTKKLFLCIFEVNYFIKNANNLLQLKGIHFELLIGILYSNLFYCVQLCTVFILIVF